MILVLSIVFSVSYISSASLVAHWKLDDTSNSSYTIDDDTANNHDATSISYP